MNRPRGFIAVVAAGLNVLAACEPLVINLDASVDDAETDAGATSDVEALEPTLTIRLVGDGRGVVRSSPPGVDCGNGCAASFPDGTRVSLTATAEPGSRLRGSPSFCAGDASSECTFEIRTDLSLDFDFGLVEYTLTASIAGEGEGHVESLPNGIQCGSQCEASFAADTQVTLTARPHRSSTFVGWAGACAGMPANCALSLSNSKSVTAIFATPAGMPRYSSIVELPTIPDATIIYAWSVNEQDEAVGSVTDSAGVSHAYRATADGYTILGPLGMPGTSAWSNNATGWTVGEAHDGPGNRRAYLCAPAPSKMLVDLGTLGGAESHASGINSANWIVGRSDTAAGERHAFRRDPNGMMIDLGTLGGDYSAAGDINDSGWTVGEAKRADGFSRPFRVGPEPDRGLVELPTLGGPEGGAAAINASGTVVGGSQITGGAGHAFTIGPSPATAAIDLGTLGGSMSLAYSISGPGQVVGISTTSEEIIHGFIWDPSARVMVDLNELLPKTADEWEIQFAGDINDAGVVVGSGVHRGFPRAYLLIP